MKRTPLYAEHAALGARLVDFAGWEMPVQYPSGIQAEHLAVRTGCGLFDVSHMGELRVRGPDAARFLSFATLNDPAKLRVGQGQYSMLPNDRGGLVDDIYLYRDHEDDFLMVVNAGNHGAARRHLEALAGGYDVRLGDESDSWALLALQGPGAALALSRLVEGDVQGIKKNRKRAVRFKDFAIDAARTGYTGEDGFELFCQPEHAAALWRALLESGARPCGLGARDTLRLEAGFPLFGHEFTDATNPLCSDYAWVVKDKPFYGREALWNPECARRLVGLRLLERGIPRQGYPLYAGERHHLALDPRRHRARVAGRRVRRTRHRARGGHPPRARRRRGREAALLPDVLELVLRLC
jgi:aminomethyltransferase